MAYYIRAIPTYRVYRLYDTSGDENHLCDVSLCESRKICLKDHAHSIDCHQLQSQFKLTYRSSGV